VKLTVKLPEFTLTRGKVPGSEGRGFSGLRRNFRRIVGWGAVGLVFFVLFAWLSLPTRALAWRLSHEAKARGYIVDIEDISVSPFGGITLENVQWTFAPSRPDQVPTKFVVEEIEVDVSILSLLMGDIDVSVEAQLDEGLITARYARGSDESSFGLEISELPLYGVPKAAQALNAPLRGLLHVKVDLTMPEHQFAQAHGSIELTCAACKIGDGEEKLYVPGSAALKSGVVVPEIDMGTLSGRMTVEDGVANTDGPIETKSDDVWIELSGSLTFKDPFAKSRFAMVLKFNLSEELQAESEPMRFMIQTANPKTKLDPPEQGLGFKLEGAVSAPRFIGIKSVSRQQSRADKRAKQRERDEKRRKKTTKTATGDDDKADAKAGDEGGEDGRAPQIGEPLDVQPYDPGAGGKPALPTPRDPSEMPPSDPSAGDPGAGEPPPVDPGQPIPFGGGEEPQDSAGQEPPPEPSPYDPPQYPAEPPTEEPPPQDSAGQEVPVEEQPVLDGGAQDGGAVQDGGGEGG
jgi:type II secretion system protein N